MLTTVDGEIVWWDDAVSNCRGLADQLDGRRVAGICVSGSGPCLVLTVHEDRSVRPAILDGVDMRATRSW